MKQHISVEQVWELAKNKDDWDSITRFNTLAKIRFYGFEKNFNDCCKTTAEQTTIGKIIEILRDKELYVSCFMGQGYNRVTISSYDYETTKEFEYDNLCDVLWQAVKYVLGEVK